MTFIDVDATFSEVIEVFREVKYTRYPVYEETTDNVIGIINIKDLLLTENQKKFCIRDYLREPLYTYEFKKTAELMVELRKTQNNIAIVLDEYGPRQASLPWRICWRRSWARSAMSTMRTRRI